MPAYSFQERFCPMILDGSKDHTIRADRAGRAGHAKVGDKVYLYYGMRTKWCKKLGESICLRRDDVTIYRNGKIKVAGHIIKQNDAFAWSDGFRPEGSTQESPAGAHAMMMRFWNQTHELPFTGKIIYWNPSLVTNKKINNGK